MSTASDFKVVMDAAQARVPPAFDSENVQASVTEYGGCHMGSTPVAIQLSATTAAALGRWLVSTFE